MLSEAQARAETGRFAGFGVCGAGGGARTENATVCLLLLSAKNDRLKLRCCSCAGGLAPPLSTATGGPRFWGGLEAWSKAFFPTRRVFSNSPHTSFFDSHFRWPFPAHNHVPVQGKSPPHVGAGACGRRRAWSGGAGAHGPPLRAPRSHRNTGLFTARLATRSGLVTHPGQRAWPGTGDASESFGFARPHRTVYPSPARPAAASLLPRAPPHTTW